MTKQIKILTARAENTYLGDMIGGVALMVTLLGGLYLPGVF